MNGIVSTTLYPEVIKNIFLSKYELGEERRRSSVSVVSGPTSNIDTAQTRVCRAPVTIQYCHAESAESTGRGADDDHPLYNIQIQSCQILSATVLVLRIQILYLYIFR